MKHDMLPLRKKIAQAKAAYLEAVKTQPAHICEALSATHRRFNQDLVDHLTEDANPCPSCGGKPHGMIHQRVVNTTPPRPVEMIEVGCTRCKDHRADGFSRDEAVSRWNTGDWKPAKAE